MTGAVNQILGRFKTWSVAHLGARELREGNVGFLVTFLREESSRAAGQCEDTSPRVGLHAMLAWPLTTDLGRENSTRGQRHQGGHRYVIIQGAGEINQCDKAKTLQDNDDNKSDKIELKREGKCRTNVGWNLFTVTLDILCIFM